MKFLNLNLIAYGPFTEILLPLPEEKSFHLIYGPNEAGKSSALRALTSALFGIKPTSSDTFLHSKSELRIGVSLLSPDRKALDFIRKSGRTKSLLDPKSNNSLPSNALEEFLSVADEDNFKEIYAIDYLELRAGGDAILQGKGAADQALFTAGTGGVNLNAILEQLEGSANALFSVKGRTKSIHVKLSDYKKTKKTLKDSNLKASAYKEKQQTLATAEDRINEIADEKSKIRTAQSRLNRLEILIPKANQKKVLTEQLESLIDVPDLPASFTSNRQSYSIKLDVAEKSKKYAIAAIKKLQQKKDGIHIEPGLIENAPVIRGLGQQIAQYKSARDDLPKLKTESENIERKINIQLMELPMDATIENIGDFRLNVDVKAKLTELASRYPDLASNLRECKRELKRIEDETDKSQAKLENSESVPDFTSLVQTMLEAKNEGAIESKLDELTEELARIEDKIELELRKLNLWDGSMTELESLVVPSVETIDFFTRKFDSVEQKIEKESDKYEAVINDIRGNEQEIETMEKSVNIATEEELTEARNYRDKGWGIIKKVWMEGKLDDEAIADFCAGKELHKGYEDSVANADSIADVLRENSDRTVSYAKLLVSLGKNQEKRDELKLALDKLGEQKGELQKEWEGRWVKAGISPISPREMISWHRQYLDLVTRSESIRALNVKISSLSDRINLHRDKITKCLRALKIEDVLNESTLLELLERAEDVKTILEERSRTRSELEKSIEQREKQLPTLITDAEVAEDGLKQWESDWSEVLTSMKLPLSIKPVQAIAVERVIADILVKKDDVIKLNSRISKISETIQKFENETKELTANLAPDLKDLPADIAIDGLQTHLEKAQKDDKLLPQLAEQLDEKKGALEKAEGEISEFGIKLSDLCKIAGVDDPKDLESVEEQAGYKKELTGKLDQIILDIAEFSSGFSDDEIAALANEDIDSIKSKLLASTETLSELDKEKDKLIGSSTTITNEIMQMEQSGEMLADNQAASEQIISEIKEDSEMYIRLRLASHILLKEMERYREANEHPILKSAGNFFQKMTLGSFEMIRTEIQGDQNPVLVGIRPDGEHVRVEGMSEGTLDQLFLALKLALMTHQIENEEPMPLILDDLLVNFDDERARAALEILDEISEHTQILFFTHHKHLAKIALDTVRKERVNEIDLSRIS